LAGEAIDAATVLAQRTKRIVTLSFGAEAKPAARSLGIDA